MRLKLTRKKSDYLALTLKTLKDGLETPIQFSQSWESSSKTEKARGEVYHQNDQMRRCGVKPSSAWQQWGCVNSLYKRQKTARGTLTQSPTMFSRNLSRILLCHRSTTTPQRTGNEEVDYGGMAAAVLLDGQMDITEQKEPTATEFAAISLRGNSHFRLQNIFNEHKGGNFAGFRMKVNMIWGRLRYLGDR